MLCRAVRSNVAVTFESGCAGNIHNTSPAGLKHGRQNGMNAMKGAVQVHLHHAAPESDVRLQKRSRASLACIVHQNVYRTKLSARRAKRMHERFSFADIGLNIVKMW